MLLGVMHTNNIDQMQKNRIQILLLEKMMMGFKICCLAAILDCFHSNRWMKFQTNTFFGIFHNSTFKCNTKITNVQE